MTNFGWSLTLGIMDPLNRRVNESIALLNAVADLQNAIYRDALFGANIQACQYGGQQGQYGAGLGAASEWHAVYGRFLGAQNVYNVVAAEVWPAPLKPEVTKYRGSRYATARCHPVWQVGERGYRRA